jgi:hypothetical protein
VSLAPHFLLHRLSGVDCSFDLWTEAYLGLFNFVFPSSICILLEINFMYFVLFYILCLYYWHFFTSWNETDGLCSDLIVVFFYDGFSNHECQDFTILCSSRFRQEVDGTYMLELHKDEKKGEAKATIVMDFCTEVVRVSSDLRFCSNTACVSLVWCHNYII